MARNSSLLLDCKNFPIDSFVRPVSLTTKNRLLVYGMVQEIKSRTRGVNVTLVVKPFAYCEATFPISSGFSGDFSSECYPSARKYFFVVLQGEQRDNFSF